MHPNANPNDARMRELLMRHLAQRGFETLAAGDGRELDRQLSRNHVDPIVLDLIVLDLMLPGEDGLSICRRLRGQVAETPIVRPGKGAWAARCRDAARTALDAVPG